MIADVFSLLNCAPMKLRYLESPSSPPSLLVITFRSPGNIRSFLASFPPDFRPLSQAVNSDWSSGGGICSSCGRGHQDGLNSRRLLHLGYQISPPHHLEGARCWNSRTYPHTSIQRGLKLCPALAACQLAGEAAGAGS